MRKLLLILLLFITGAEVTYAQFPFIINGQRYSGTATVARFNFSRPANAVAGYTNMVATSSTSVGSLSVTDGSTGWTLITNGSMWEPYAGSIAHLTNGDGGSSAGSPTYTDFSAAALSCGFINAGHTFAVSGTTYPFEFTNLPAGTYEVRVISSVKATVNGNLPNGIWYCKFGTNSPTNQTISQQSNYTTPALIFTGTITAGQRIYFGPFTPSEGNTDGTICNCIMITKTS